MNPQTSFYAKLGLVALVLVGGFVLAAIGRIDAAAMFDKSSTLIGQLVIALGISAAGGAIAGGGSVASRMLMGRQVPDKDKPPTT